MPRPLSNEMSNLKKKVLFLGGLVENNLRMAMRAFREKDLDLAQRLRESDREVNDTEIAVEGECLRILALHKPLAGDLRFVVTVLKINGDLERIGDIVAKIGKKILRLATPDKMAFLSFREPLPDFTPIFDKTIWMVKSSLDSFVGEDADLAYRVIIVDDEVDTAKHEIRKALEKIPVQDQSQSKAVDLLLGIARNMERIADHATNIAEDAIYMMQGKIVRHIPGREIPRIT